MIIPMKAKIRENAKQSVPNLHYGEMKTIARASTSQLSTMLNLTSYESKTGKKFWYKDNGGTVLMVAHSDTVKRPGVFQPVKGREDTRIFCPTWDDRAGIYVYQFLSKMGFKIDFLMTEDEEQRKSTALWFDAPKKYNWMFMFDRKGTDAVTYQYGDEKLNYRLGKHGFNVGWGSYSCIRDLEHLGIQGMNIGTGYHDNHTEWAYLSVKELRRNLGSFINFYREYKGIRMLHDLGYEKFAQAVTTHANEQLREDQEENFMLPALSIEREYNDPYKLTHGSEDEKDFWKRADKIRNRDIEDANYMEIRKEFAPPDFSFDDSGEFKAAEIKKVQDEILEESKAMMLVDEHGILRGRRDDRNVSKLYWPVEILSKHDPSTKNILTNTFGCKYLYDVVKLSPWRLCAQGNFTLPQAQKLHEYMVSIGFNMPYNLQGFKTPEVWFHEEAANALYRRKAASNLPNSKDLRKWEAKKAEVFLASNKAKKFLKKYKEPSKIDNDQIKKLGDKVRLLEKKYDETTSKNWKIRWLNKLNEAKEALAQFTLKVKSVLQKEPLGPIQGPRNRPCSVTTPDDKFKNGKYVQLFPLPEGKGSYEELIHTARELNKDGAYDLDVMFTCGQCRKSIVFDVEKNNQLPKICDDCRADQNSEFLEMEETLLSHASEELDPSNTIYAKVQLKKDDDDDSIYQYTGKTSNNEGVDKYAWCKPTPDGEVGFVRADTEQHITGKVTI